MAYNIFKVKCYEQEKCISYSMSITENNSTTSGWHAQAGNFEITTGPVTVVSPLQHQTSTTTTSSEIESSTYNSSFCVKPVPGKIMSAGGFLEFRLTEYQCFNVAGCGFED